MKLWLTSISIVAAAIGCGGTPAEPGSEPGSVGDETAGPSLGEGWVGVAPLPVSRDAGPVETEPGAAEPPGEEPPGEPGVDAGSALSPEEPPAEEPPAEEPPAEDPLLEDAGAASPADAGSQPPAAGDPDAGSARPGAVARSAGCGASGVAGTGDFVTREIRVGGADRIYRLRVPSTYDPDRAYPVVFRWHGLGGDGLSGGLGVEYAAGEDAIVVSGDAVSSRWDLSPGGRDVTYFDALYDEVQRELCVDLDRVFSYGFSRGGGMTNLLACVRGHVLRGSAAVAGLAVTGVSCGEPTAEWLLHDEDDEAVSFWHGTTMRDRALAANGCGATTTPVDPAPCVRYEGCDPGLPVVWCQTQGVGHNIRGDLAPAAVWAFFESL